MNAAERNVYFFPMSIPELKEILSRPGEWESHPLLRQPALSWKQHAALRAGMVWGHTLSLRGFHHFFESGPVEMEKIHFAGKSIPGTRAIDVEQATVDLRPKDHPDHRKNGVALSELKSRPNCRSFLKALLQL